MQTRFKFRHVNELTGLFVIAVFALVVTGLVFSGHSQRWFSRKYSFDVLLPEAGTSGLRRGDEVFILGVSAGLVDDIIVRDDGRVKARVQIRRDFERLVRVDSSASIKKAFAVAGDSFMEISRGTGAPLPGEAPSITCLPSEDSLDRMEKMLASLSSELIPVVKRAGAGVDEWTKLSTDLQKSQQQASGLFRRLDSLIAGLEQGKGTAGKLLGDSTLADEAQTLLGRANETMNQLQVMVTNLSAAIKDVQIGMARVPEIAEAVARETKDLPGLVSQTQTSMRELERLVEALQRHWLVRKYVDKSDPPPGKGSGLQAGEVAPSGKAAPPGKAANTARSPKDSNR